VGGGPKTKADIPLFYLFCFPSILQVITRALQLHPTVPALWLYAASFEFQHQRKRDCCADPTSTRPAHEPESEQLWVEALRLEVAQARKLKARRLVLSGEAERLQAQSQGTVEEEGVGRGGG